MASKKQQARARARTNATRTAPPQPAQEPSGPTLRPSAMFSALRLAALMAATAVALLVFELLQQPLGFWPALLIGFGAAIIARAVFYWLERAWLRAAARRAHRLEEQRAGQARGK